MFFIVFDHVNACASMRLLVEIHNKCTPWPVLNCHLACSLFERDSNFSTFWLYSMTWKKGKKLSCHVFYFFWRKTKWKITIVFHEQLWTTVMLRNPEALFRCLIITLVIIYQSSDVRWSKKGRFANGLNYGSRNIWNLIKLLCLYQHKKRTPKEQWDEL